MYAKGDIIIISFPFSDFVHAKKRPVVVLAEKGEDIICCAITSNPESEGVPVECDKGSLPLKSKIKYWQIHTFLKSFAVSRVAHLSRKRHDELLDKINKFFK